MTKTVNEKNIEIAYLILRLTMGFNMFAHGLVRLPKLDAFNSWMVGLFENSMLPIVLVKPFGYALPIIELIVGICLILGFQTAKSIHAGGLIIAALVFGSCMIEKWDMAGGQMLYAIFFFILAVYLNKNTYSLDKVFFKG